VFEEERESSGGLTWRVGLPARGGAGGAWVRPVPKPLEHFSKGRKIIDTRSENASQTEEDLVTISRVDYL
jgi:hypothetical protein